MANEWMTSKIINWLRVDKDSITGIKVSFCIETMLAEVEKIIIILSVFSALGHFSEVAIILFIIIAIRPYIGGSHERTYTRCLVKTILICAIPIYMHEIISDSCEIHIVVIMLCVIWTIGPVASKYRPKYEVMNCKG